MPRRIIISFTLSLAFASPSLGLEANHGATGDGPDKINADRDTNQVGGKCRTTPGVNMEQIRKWFEADRAKRGANSNIRYVYIPPDMLADEEAANLARVGLFKGLNHTSPYQTQVHIGEDVSEKHGVLYAIDPTALWGDQGAENWETIADPINRGRSPFSPAPSIAAEAFDANQPAPADQVVYNALYGNVYNKLIDMPEQERQLRTRLGINNTPVAYGAIKEAIVYGPRIFSLYTGTGGVKYWVSADEFANAEGRDIPYGPDQLPNYGGGPKVDVFGTQAHEAWSELPNGFNAYYIWGNAEQERSKAEQNFVIDPNNKRTRDLINGRSCITCHMTGVQAAPSDLAGEGSRWTSNEELAKHYSGTRDRFQAAMREVLKVACNAQVTWIEDVIAASFKREPVNVLIQRVEGTGDGTLDIIWDEDSIHGG